MQNIKTIPQLAVQNLPADLESKADADEVVLLTGNQTVEGNKNLTETPVIQLWNADINPTANQTIVFSINSVGTFELYKNKTGINGSNPPAQDGTNWEFISTCQGSRAYVQEFAPSESPVSSITLTEGICYNADFMTVAVDHTILDPSAYTLGINGTTITFVEPVEAGLTITVRWFTEMNLSNVYRQPLLTCFWSDHLIYELSYICADPFSWQDGNVYSAAYNHLVADIEGKSILTDGLITYYQADDGHKIATAVSHDAVANLYDETGVSWYYILDVENHRFKLPRTKYAFSGWRGDVGGYIPESLPNITGTITPAIVDTSSGTVGALPMTDSSGALYSVNSVSTRKYFNPSGTVSGSYAFSLGLDASNSSSAYQDGAPVQQRGTQMYLYFYVGNYTPQAIEQTAGYAQTLTELKADKDLANSPYTTNRILEIPQDIKLELVDGTLTLKAGSKVYVPNGFEEDGTTPKFDVVTIQSDLSYIEPLTNAITAQVFYDTNKNKLIRRGMNPESGSSVPSGFHSVFYNTSTNLCYNYLSGTQESKFSFPICICTSNGQETNNISSIDQVFNGFGYIGSTDFLLPGVKIQIANGQNANGTCITEIQTVDSVLTHTDTRGIYSYYISTSNRIQDSFSIKIQKSMPSGIYNLWFNPDENQWRTQGGTEGDFAKNKVFPLWKRNVNSSGQITSLDLFFSNVDSCVTSNALNFSSAGRSYLSGIGMPSDRYIELTVGASGSTYTAPANGWFRWSTPSGTGTVTARTNRGNMNLSTYSSNKNNRGNIAVGKGTVLILEYSGVTPDILQFIYAEGEN